MVLFLQIDTVEIANGVTVREGSLSRQGPGKVSFTVTSCNLGFVNISLKVKCLPCFSPQLLQHSCFINAICV